MKKLFISFATIYLLAASCLSADQPSKKNCRCQDCKCTVEKNCGCFSEKGCHSPAGTQCDNQSSSEESKKA